MRRSEDAVLLALDEARNGASWLNVIPRIVITSVGKTMVPIL